jgi:hypothetical protein
MSDPKATSSSTNVGGTRPLKKFQTKEDLEEDFMITGELDRLKEIMIKRLYETGWTAKVEDLSREIIIKKV